MYRTLIDVATLLRNLHQDDWVIVDCRFDLANPDAGYDAYQKRHIRGAVYADLDHDLSGPPLTDQGRHPLPSPARMRQVFGRLGIDRTKQVVVYDEQKGVPAARLWWMLRYLGHESVAVLDGGWQAWLRMTREMRGQSSDPSASPTEDRGDQEWFDEGNWFNEPTEFTGTPHESWLVVLDQVPQQQLLVDSRSAERFAGLVEPIDPVAGHIPGAVNHPYVNNQDEQGQMKEVGSIRDQLTEVFGETPAEEVAFYCGSGVSACVNLLAAAHAGFPMSKLYVGSWSEWCRQ